MMFPRMISASALLALQVLAISALSQPAKAQSSPPQSVARAGEGLSRVQVTIGTPHVIDLPADAKEVFVTDPATVTAMVRGNRKLVLSGKITGSAEVFVQDALGKPLQSFTVIVSRNMQELQAIIKSVLPDRKLTLTPVGRQVILTGEAGSIEEVEKIDLISKNFLGDGVLVNQLNVRDPDQVMIKVTIAEVQRAVVKDFGIKTKGTWTLGRVEGTAALGNRIELSEVARLTMSGSDVLNLAMLERTGALRTLAEPTLTALSGQSATFLAGGEVPVSGGVTCGGTNTSGTNNCVATVNYKKVGIELKFSPVVLSAGRIRMRVSTTVNELDPSTYVSIGGTTVYGFRTRELDTTVELPSGGSMMTAGLLQQQSSVQLQGTPGLMNIPVLGALFRSKEYSRRETELVVVVVPYIAKSSKPESIALPTDAYVFANEANQVLLGRISKQSGGTALNTGRTVSNTGFVAQ